MAREDRKTRMRRVAQMVTYCSQQSGDPTCVIVDFLADMTQWCDVHGYDIKALFSSSQKQVDDMWEFYA
jgi:16S rRNA U1498 N3-methylase RsmE